MSLAPEWEAKMAAGGVSYGFSADFQMVLKHHVTEAERTLELGAGVGGNIPIFLGMPTDYYGIEGSPTAVANMLKARPFLKGKLVQGDFTKEIPWSGFDLIAERASLAHNSLADIKNAVKLIYGALNPGGLFVSSDWFSSSHSEWGRGNLIEANGTAGKTVTGYTDGQFANIGPVHFSSEEELTEIFGDFERITLQERVCRRPAPGGFCERVTSHRWVSLDYRLKEYRSAVWDIVVRKPK